MTAQDEFESWYYATAGITIAEARRLEVFDLQLLQSAFMAGRIAGRNEIIVKNTCLCNGKTKRPENNESY